MTTLDDTIASEQHDEPSRRRRMSRRKRDLIVGLVALLIAVWIGTWIGYYTTGTVHVYVSCGSIGSGAPPHVQDAHLRPGSSFGTECNVRIALRRSL
jgi:hypothetical protein